jgi:enoyl-CoA hydratase/carnithine racemase
MTISLTQHIRAIRILTIDHPPVNALDQETINELAEAVAEASKTGEVRTIIITGAGNLFVAGADLDELARWNAESAKENVAGVKAAMASLRKSPKLVIAAINGMAAGGGLELAMSCDIRIAAKDASLCLPEATLGILPGAGGTQLLPRLIGVGRALEMMTTGRIVTAEEAFSLGLIDRLAGEKGALQEAISLAEKIARNAPLAVAGIKASAWATFSMPLEEGLTKETGEFARLCDSEDKKIGIAAFKSRERAVFKGL